MSSAATPTRQSTGIPAANPTNGIKIAGGSRQGSSASFSAVSNMSLYSSNPDISSDETSNFFEKSKKETTALAKKEDKAVWGLRLLVLLVLVGSMIGVAAAVYIISSRQERTKFQLAFKEDSAKVFQQLAASLDVTLGMLDVLCVSAVSHARATNQSWPFVTVPDFAVRAEKVLRLTNALWIDVYPIVAGNQRREWEDYTAQHGRQWVQEGNQFMVRSGLWKGSEVVNVSNMEILDVIWQDNYTASGNWVGAKEIPRTHPGPFMPRWQGHATLDNLPYNWELLTGGNYNSMLAVWTTHNVTISDSYIEESVSWSDNGGGDVFSVLNYPILADNVDVLRLHNEEQEESYDPTQHQLVGILSATIVWSDYMTSILPQGSDGLVVVFENACNLTFTYQINGPSVELLGEGDLHETKYNGKSELLFDLSKYNHNHKRDNKISYTGMPVNRDYCPYTVHVYPSSRMASLYMTSGPIVATVVAVLIFAFTALVFFVYDNCVERRQRVVMRTAVRANDLVASLFPSNVRDRLFETRAETRRLPGKLMDSVTSSITMGDNKQIPAPGATGMNLPIADSFPAATVLFADLAGFTAWSSSRDPTQVFRLLETLYGEFDRIAKRRGVFKIETIGDCYVAVTGVPTPRTYHAVIMSRFAAEIRTSMNSITDDLELTLGPGTGDLKLRVGLHSGAVTAGVLRGDKSRFQLFGDTVNTAARMESNGTPNRIHCSQKTADLLIQAKRGDWLTMREDMIEAKGKGKMQTYWVEPVRGKSGGANSNHGNIPATVDVLEEGGRGLALMQSQALSTRESFIAKNRELGDISEGLHGAKLERLIEWNVSLLDELLKKLVARRKASFDPKQAKQPLDWKEAGEAIQIHEHVAETLPMLPYVAVDPKAVASVKLIPEVLQQLRAFISVVAHSSSTNPFHNFDRSCHAVLSTKRLLQQIAGSAKTVTPNEMYIQSFGIATDPLASIALLFAALILDAGHLGVHDHTNEAQVTQNAFDIAWTIFKDETAHSDLHACLFASQDELLRFRQLVVNFLVATQVSNPEIQTQRNVRRQAAFAEQDQEWIEDVEATRNNKATILMQDIIQASAVCHCMQPWVVYQKWNRRLYEECHRAHSAGLTSKDPEVDWYEDELQYFDVCILPLARSICEIMGAAGQEFLDNAMENRLEWEEKGREIVDDMRISAMDSSRSTGLTTTTFPTMADILEEVKEACTDDDSVLFGNDDSVSETLEETKDTYTSRSSSSSFESVTREANNPAAAAETSELVAAPAVATTTAGEAAEKSDPSGDYTAAEGDATTAGAQSELLPTLEETETSGVLSLASDHTPRTSCVSSSQATRSSAAAAAQVPSATPSPPPPPPHQPISTANSATEPPPPPNDATQSPTSAPSDEHDLHDPGECKPRSILGPSSTSGSSGEHLPALCATSVTRPAKSQAANPVRDSSESLPSDEGGAAAKAEGGRLAELKSSLANAWASVASNHSTGTSADSNVPVREAAGSSPVCVSPLTQSSAMEEQPKAMTAQQRNNTLARPVPRQPALTEDEPVEHESSTEPAAASDPAGDGKHAPVESASHPDRASDFVPIGLMPPSVANHDKPAPADRSAPPPPPAQNIPSAPPSPQKLATKKAKKSKKKKRAMEEAAFLLSNSSSSSSFASSSSSSDDAALQSSLASTNGRTASITMGAPPAGPILHSPKSAASVSSGSEVVATAPPPPQLLRPRATKPAAQRKKDPRVAESIAKEAFGSASTGGQAGGAEFFL